MLLFCKKIAIFLLPKYKQKYNYDFFKENILHMDKQTFFKSILFISSVFDQNHWDMNVLKVPIKNSRWPFHRTNIYSDGRAPAAKI